MFAASVRVSSFPILAPLYQVGKVVFVSVVMSNFFIKKLCLLLACILGAIAVHHTLRRRFRVILRLRLRVSSGRIAHLVFK